MELIRGTWYVPYLPKVTSILANGFWIISTILSFLVIQRDHASFGRACKYLTSSFAFTGIFFLLKKEKMSRHYCGTSLSRIGICS